MTKIIDIDNILRSKMGAKARFVPRWAVNWLRRILHEDYLNDFLTANSHLTGVEWIEACLRHLDVRLEVVGEERLPKADDGRLYTFVSNHPLGGQDGIALGWIIGRHYDGRFRYLVNDLLMNLPGLAPLCVPINKTGAQSRNFPAMVKACFESNNHVLMFPAGLCSRRDKRGVIRDLEWRKAFITKSVETHRDIVPIHFSGRNSDRFYNLAYRCKQLGIKFNVAMIFLVDELYRNRHKTFRVTIGEPIPWQTFNKTKSPKEWAQWVQDKVYDLEASPTQV